MQLHNPRITRMTGRLVYHPAGSSATPTDPVLTYVLEPGETLSIADLLPAMGLTGLGSLDVVPDTGTATPLLVVRVFNDAGAAGTTGFAEEGVTPAEALVAGELGFLIAPPDPALYRFNVGVRTLVSGATLTITARNAAGTVTRTLTRTYLPNYFEQRDSASFLNGAAAAANLPPLSDQETAELVSHLITTTVLSPELERAVLERAGGNPLYAEEFVRLKRMEWIEYSRHVSGWETDRYLEFF